MLPQRSTHCRTPCAGRIEPQASAARADSLGSACNEPCKAACPPTGALQPPASACPRAPCLPSASSCCPPPCLASASDQRTFTGAHRALGHGIARRGGAGRSPPRRRWSRPPLACHTQHGWASVGLTGPAAGPPAAAGTAGTCRRRAPAAGSRCRGTGGRRGCTARACGGWRGRGRAGARRQAAGSGRQACRVLQRPCAAAPEVDPRASSSPAHLTSDMQMQHSSSADKPSA